MNRDAILQAARDAGIAGPKSRVGDDFMVHWGSLERFAESMRSATKEEDARICSDWSKEHAKHDGCTYANCDYVAAAIDCADAIRASK